MNKQEQRTFGITKNLLKKPIPKFYGAGDHKVQLAYITPDEANLLADLDLHGSNPPNPGPGGIPNFNDPGTGMSGAAASASEAGPNAGTRGRAEAAAQGVSIGSSPVGSSGNVDYGGATTAPGIGPSDNLGNVSESGFNNDPNNTANTDKKSFKESVKNLFSQKMSLPGILGTAIGYGLFGPFGGFLGGTIGGTYGDDDESNNFFGNVGQNLQTDFDDTKNFFSNEEGDFSLGNLFDGIGNLFGPAVPMDPRDLRGNNNAQNLTTNLTEDADPVEDDETTEEEETSTFVPNYGGTFKFDPVTNSFGFRP